MNLSTRFVRFALGGVVLAFVACGLNRSDPAGGSNNGAPCADSSSGGQSTCLSDLTCLPISPDNMCSYLGCNSNTDCGSWNGAQNYCLSGGSFGTSTGCVRGCASPDAGTDGGSDGGQDAGVNEERCGRPDFTCAKDTSSGLSYCVPDCRLLGANYCSYGTVCDTSTDDTAGTCLVKACSTTADCPSGSGAVCATVNGTSTCVPACPATACPAGRKCNSTGGCDVITLEIYAPCSASLGTCDTTQSLVCAEATSSASICLPVCTSDSQCPAASGTIEASTCSVSDGTNNYCLPPCIQGATTCPGALTCQAITSGTQTVYYCLP